MSKFTRVKTKINDRAALQAALEDLGVPFEVGQKLPLYGFQGDLRPETANLVIRRRYLDGASNDMGFAWSDETQSYETIISEFDSRPGRRAMQIMGQLPRRYALHKVQLEASARGFDVVQENQPDGSIRLQLTRW